MPIVDLAVVGAAQAHQVLERVVAAFRPQVQVVDVQPQPVAAAGNLAPIPRPMEHHSEIPSINPMQEGSL